MAAQDGVAPARFRPPVVELGYRIYSISHVQPHDELVTADMRVFVLYRDPCCAGHKGLDAGLSDPAEFMAAQGLSRAYVPFVTFGNASTTEKVDGGYRVMSDEGDVKLHVRVVGQFHQQYDLEGFPFDTQVLKFVIRIPRNEDCEGVTFKVHPVYGGPRDAPEAKGNTMNEFQLTEWQVHVPSFAAVSSHASSKTKGELVVEVPISRLYNDYLYAAMWSFRCAQTQ